MKKFMLILFGMITLLVLAGCSSSEEAPNGESIASANSAPNFTLYDVNGGSHTLSDYAGKKVYVKFWASWCSICLAGMEDINTLAKDEEDFMVLTVVSPGFRNEKDTDSFKKWFSGVEEAKNLTVLLDEGGKITDQFQVRGYPTSAYIDSNGLLVQVLPGHVSNEVIIQKMETIQ
ncbi:redoxin family protein [Paenibacillus chungangensis]|uniref:Redoxin family protein n=1 Tax=Paenibacillus chungangensis TaxID=696535 RepID=A0ABW3HL15_9BACL